MYLMPETLNALKFSKLKPSQFDEIILWDASTSSATAGDSFFRFLNPLKITKENLLGLIKNEHNSFITTKIASAESTQALIGFSHFHPIHKTAQVSWVLNPLKPLSESQTNEMLYEFCLSCFKKNNIRKLQFFITTQTKENALIKTGALKEGAYLKHFYDAGKYHDVSTYRLFESDLRGQFVFP